MSCALPWTRAKFDIMQDVIRNVLLAAPYEHEETSRGRRERRKSRRHLVARVREPRPHMWSTWVTKSIARRSNLLLRT